jgi:hypothetical protein
MFVSSAGKQFWDTKKGEAGLPDYPWTSVFEGDPPSPSRNQNGGDPGVSPSFGDDEFGQKARFS